MIRRIAAAALGAIALLGCDSRAANDDGVVTIHVIGSSATSNINRALEHPFWTERLPAASDGRVQVDFTSVTESGLKGAEVARLLRAGALHVAYSDFNTVSGDLREFEGLELAGVITDFDTLYRAADAYKPVIERLFNQQGIHLLGLVPYPEYAFYCRGQVTSLADLAGKKVRVTAQAMSDFVHAIGAVPVTIGFPDVVPALQTGVADCAVTGTYSGNRAGWHEFTDSLYTLPVGGGVAFYGFSARNWLELDPELRTLIETEFAAFEAEAWELTRQQSQTGINCNTGVGPCEGGHVGRMVLHRPSEADIARAHEIAQQIVMPNWSRRCSAECITNWNATVGRVAGVQIAPPQ
jgi:TRAP-type C4-dicarboxylate transport system substrate-binding protein